MERGLTLNALMMALAYHRPGLGILHHSDRGSLLGLNWSSRHHLLNVIGETDRVPRPECANPSSFVVACSA